MKCFDKMAEIRNSGATVVVVSHNLNAVRRMCDHTMVLHNGAQRFYGATADAISLFHQLLGEEREPRAATPKAKSEVRGLATVESWRARRDQTRARCRRRRRAVLRSDRAFAAPVDDPIFAFSISTDRGQMVYGEAVAMPAGRSFAPGDTTTFRVRVAQRNGDGLVQGGARRCRAPTRSRPWPRRAPSTSSCTAATDARGVTDLRGGFDFGQKL